MKNSLYLTIGLALLVVVAAAISVHAADDETSIVEKVDPTTEDGYAFVDEAADAEVERRRRRGKRGGAKKRGGKKGKKSRKGGKKGKKSRKGGRKGKKSRKGGKKGKKSRKGGKKGKKSRKGGKKGKKSRKARKAAKKRAAKRKAKKQVAKFRGKLADMLVKSKDRVIKALNDKKKRLEQAQGRNEELRRLQAAVRQKSVLMKEAIKRKSEAILKRYQELDTLKKAANLLKSETDTGRKEVKNMETQLINQMSRDAKYASEKAIKEFLDAKKPRAGPPSYIGDERKIDKDPMPLGGHNINTDELMIDSFTDDPDVIDPAGDYSRTIGAFVDPMHHQKLIYQIENDVDPEPAYMTKHADAVKSLAEWGKKAARNGPTGRAMHLSKLE